MAYRINTNPVEYLDRLRYYNELDKNIDETAQSAVNEAAQLVPTDSDSPDFAPRLKSLVTLLVRRFRRTAAMEDLQHAILRALEMVATTPPCHPDRGARVEDWIDLMLAKVGLEGYKDDDLDEVFEMAQQVGATVNMIPGEHGCTTYASEQTTGNLHCQYQDLPSDTQPTMACSPPNPTDLDVLLSPEHLTWRDRMLISSENIKVALCEAHASDKYPDPEIGGATIDDDLDRTMQYNYHLALHCSNHRGRASLWYFQSDMFYVKYRRHGRMEDLEQAVILAELAKSELPPEDPNGNLIDILGLLVDLMMLKYSQTRSRDDLDRGVDYARQVCETTPRNDPRRIVLVDRLANLLHELYQVTGMAEHLQESIFFTEETVAIGEQSRGYRWLIAMNLLASRLQDKFDLDGAISCLDESILYAKRVVEHTPKGDPELWVRRNNLGGKFFARYVRYRNPEDLDTAIKINQEAMQECASESDINFVGLAYGALLHNRYDLRHDMADLELAIEWTERAVNQLPVKAPHRPMYEFNLANQYYTKYEAQNDISKSFIPNAMDFNDPRLLDVLTTSPEVRLQRLNVQDLDISITWYQKALRDLPQNHVTTARMALCAGKAVQSRYFRTYLLEDLQDAIAYYKKAWHENGSRLLERIQGAREAGQLHALEKNFEEASCCLTAAVEMLPMVSPRSIEDEDKQHMLGKFAGLASMAAAVALEANHGAYEALKLLEMGRGVMTNLLLELRTDVSELRQRHPALAENFEALREVLSSQSGTTDNPRGNAPASLLAEGRRRYEAERRFRELVDDIRKMPGFGDFLLPPTVDELTAAAGEGFVVVLNMSVYRCDAFLIDSSGLRVLHLPKLKFEDAEDQARRLGQLKGAFCTTSLLEWLWDVAASPILDNLGLRHAPTDGKWPRIWWILTGPLIHLPFHAAGYHRENSTETILDRAMSSYSTSASSFVHARRQSPTDVARMASGQAVLVAMRETRGMNTLEFATDEVDKVDGICTSMGLTVVRPEPPTRAETLRCLQSCNIFHFAGHGRTNSKDPSQSALLLKDQPLSVGDLRDGHFPEHSLFLAYLSACSTGAIRAEELVDEGIHLISGCQLAGFRHVVGTLWEVSDEQCVHTATKIYEIIRERGLKDETVCEAVHQTIRALRSAVVDRRQTDGRSDMFVPGRYADCEDDGYQMGRTNMAGGSFHWVPYVHFGL